MKNIIKEINQILSEWNPLDVDENVSSDEYQSYIPAILKNIENEKALICCLENILINDLEVSYDNNNDEHKKILMTIAKKIIKLKDQCR